MIINGGMQVWQRGTSATAATGSGGSYGTVDRFKFCDHGDGAYTHEKHTMSLAELNTTGHRNAIKLACTTTAPASAGHHAYFMTMLEGQDCQRPLYGTANAKDMTLSFWVKSNKTGVYTISLYSIAATNYQIAIEYTINSADTWEKKEILISPTAGSTSLITSSGGLIANGNAQAFTFYFGLHWEPSLEGTNNTWVTAGGAYGTSNQVNWLDSTSNTFYITGIQLELGSATPFEHRTYADELIRCERYYQNSYNIGQFPGSSTAGENSVHVTSWGDGNAPFCNPFRTVMRAAPTVVLRNGANETTGQVNSAGTARTASANSQGIKGVSYIAVSSGTATNYTKYTYELKAEL